MDRIGQRPAAGRKQTQMGWVAMGAVGLTAASLWLPWHRSGVRVRNAFELLDAAERSGLGSGAWIAALRVAAAITPALVAAAWLARLGRVRWVFVAAGTAVAAAVACCGVVVMAASSGWQAGAVLGLVGSGVTVTALAGEWWLKRLPTVRAGEQLSPKEDA